MSTLGVLSTGEGTMSALGRGNIMNTLGDIMMHVGGYHEYIGRCSVHQGMFSTSGDIMSTLGDIMSTSGFSIEIGRIYQVAPPHAS